MKNQTELPMSAPARSKEETKTIRLRLRMELETLKFENRILTHRSRHTELPWLAVQRDAYDRRDIATLMAEECQLLHETGRTFEARTEREAVEGLIQQLKGKR